MNLLLALFLISVIGILGQTSLHAAGMPALDSILGYEIRPHTTTSSWSLWHGKQQIFTGGEKGCRYKRLALLKEEFGTGRINIRCKTLGGKQYWADVYVLDGWRIQYHVWTKHYRLLNARDMRYAWGTWATCRTALESERVARRAQAKKDSEVVILLHGIIRSKDSLATMEKYLTDKNVEVLNINYASCQQTIVASVKNIHFLLNHRRDIRKVSFVTHSMGGLILRELMRDNTQEWRARSTLGSSVMIFPPNQGAYKANRWHQRWWYKAVLGPAGQALTSEHAQALPQLPMKLGIIVGSRGDGKGRSRIIPGDDDGTVGIEETRLASATAYSYHNVSHTFGMNDSQVVHEVEHFLAHGAFEY